MKTTSKLIKLIVDTIEDFSFELVLNVPGYGGTEAYENLKQNNTIKKTFICMNEEAAFSLVLGASLYGKRAALLIKAHGFAKACNAITSALSIGTNAANVIFVFDDILGKSSDNILDSKKLISGTEMPFFVLGDTPYPEIINAIKISESKKLPVAVLINCEKLGNEYTYERVPQKKKEVVFKRDPINNVACPFLSKYQRERLVAKLAGNDYEKIQTPKVPKIVDDLPPRLKLMAEQYIRFFDIFKIINKSFVAGDTGTSSLFAFEPFNGVDVCSYMGGSPGMAAGAYLAGAKNAWSITGDFSFFAAGILGFQEAVIKNIPLKLVIFDNSVAHATGGQEVSKVLMKNFRKIHESSIINLNTDNGEGKTEETLRIVEKSNELKIIVVNIK